MRSGLTTEVLQAEAPVLSAATSRSTLIRASLNPFFPVAACVLSLAAGCERTPSEKQSTSSTAPQQAPAGASNPIDSHSQAAMIMVPAGRFFMGDPNEVDAPVHEISVSAFLLDKNLVTQRQFEALMHENPSRWKGTNNPVEQVRWSDAVRFCNKRSQAEGLAPCYDLQTWKCNFETDGYRLPTEAEFEYACRAGTTTAYVC